MARKNRKSKPSDNTGKDEASGTTPKAQTAGKSQKGKSGGSGISRRGRSSVSSQKSVGSGSSHKSGGSGSSHKSGGSGSSRKKGASGGGSKKGIYRCGASGTTSQGVDFESTLPVVASGNISESVTTRRYQTRASMKLNPNQTLFDHQESDMRESQYLQRWKSQSDAKKEEERIRKEGLRRRRDLIGPNPWKNLISRFIIAVLIGLGVFFGNWSEEYDTIDSPARYDGMAIFYLAVACGLAAFVATNGGKNLENSLAYYELIMACFIDYYKC